MTTDVIEICPNCGSTVSITDYPELGRNVCGYCSQETVLIKLILKGLKEGVPENCSHCGENMEDEDILFEEFYGEIVHNQTVVVKCKKCENLSGYRVFEFSDYNYDEYDDRSYDSLSVKIAEQEGKPIYSASAVKRFQRKLRKQEQSLAPLRKCIEQFDVLIKNSSLQLNEAGISFETIRFVCLELQNFLKKEGLFTRKQQRSIFAAALSLIQKAEQMIYRRTIKRSVPDYQLEAIFKVTRKTIRKWRKILHDYSLFSIQFR